MDVEIGCVFAICVTYGVFWDNTSLPNYKTMDYNESICSRIRRIVSYSNHDDVNENISIEMYPIAFSRMYTEVTIIDIMVVVSHV